ncbi:MAG TPA: N-acetyltransferase [Stellaceae bacterium]|nr:N-acetyltransferase [Stellaceae bacterium]
MITIRRELNKDALAREALLDAGYGKARFTKASERLRAGRLPAAGLAFVACDRSQIVGTVRLWNVSAGESGPALLLGPLTVHPDFRRRGIGSALMRRALDDAKRLGHRAVLLVGDASYYGRFGFASEQTGALWLPGRYDAHRLLALELEPGALAGAHGLISATGRLERRFAPSARAAGLRPDEPIPRAA